MYLAYFRELRRVERTRPQLRFPCQPGLLPRVAAYREEVVRLSLAALAAIAPARPKRGGFHDLRQATAEAPCLPYLFPLVMLLQICDDLIDWRRDWRDRLPSFATAALLQSGRRGESRATALQVRGEIDRMAAAYLAAIPKKKSVYWPFALCSYAVLLLVKPLGVFATREMRREMRPARTPKSCRPPLDGGPAETGNDAISLED